MHYNGAWIIVNHNARKASSGMHRNGALWIPCIAEDNRNKIHRIVFIIRSPACINLHPSANGNLSFGIFILRIS